jgi:hypothetical protein
MFYLSIESISRFLLIGSIAVIERLSLRGGPDTQSVGIRSDAGFGSLACQVCTGFWRYNAGPANIPFQAPRDPASLYADSLLSG